MPGATGGNQWPVLFRVQEVTADEPFVIGLVASEDRVGWRQIMNWTPRRRAQQLFWRALQTQQEVLTPGYVPR